jgi:HK97 gp10 family phage protein
MATKVQNLDRLKRRLAAIPPAARKAIRDALEKSGDDWVRQARQFAPVDTGDLKASIRHEQGAHEMQENLLSGDNKAFYAHMVEFGTVKTAAQPYHVPAYRLLKKRMKSRIQRAVRKAARDSAGKS